MAQEKKTRPSVGGRMVPVTVLADVLMDEAHKAARRRKLDLTTCTRCRFRGAAR